MKSMVTQKGQTVIPSDLRKKYGIDVGTEIEWIDTGKGIKMIPVPKDIIKALRGSAKSENLTRELLSERKKDRASRTYSIGSSGTRPAEGRVFQKPV